jgi:spermidine synthase
MDPWFERNLAAIHGRLREAREAPEGLVFMEEKASYRVLVVKEGSQVQLYFADGGDAVDEVNLSGVMSRVDVEAPLHLLGTYTQAMMLALLWCPRPSRAFMLGFGGGRVPLVLHHYFPRLRLEATELDVTVISLAHRFFGIGPDERMTVLAEDGRRYLERQPPEVRYDLILVDCFTGAGHHPFALSTREFYDVCQAHLAPGGVVVTNLVETDPLFAIKVDTFVASFRHVVRFQMEGVNCLFGSEAAIDPEQARARADGIFAEHAFTFPFRELVDRLQWVEPATAGRQTLRDLQR